MAGVFCPFCVCPGSLHRIPDIFPGAFSHFSHQLPGRVPHLQGVSAVGAGLLSADIHFWGTVHVAFRSFRTSRNFEGKTLIRKGFPVFKFDIFHQALPAAFSAEARFTIPPEA
ncbi:hypothetical protein FQZ97_1169660 [compost metagenome]